MADRRLKRSARQRFTADRCRSNLRLIDTASPTDDPNYFTAKPIAACWGSKPNGKPRGPRELDFGLGAVALRCSVGVGKF